MSDDSILDALDALIAGLGQENRQDEDKYVIYNNSLKPQNQFHNSKQATAQNHASDYEKVSTENVSDSVPPRRSAKNFVDLACEAHDIRSKSGTSTDFDSLRRETIWHLAHGERIDPAICAACRRPIRAGEETWRLADRQCRAYRPRPHDTDGTDGADPQRG